MRKPVLPIPPNTNLAGKTVARQSLVFKASRVIITTRSPAKGRAAIAALLADPEVNTNNPIARVEFFDLDLDDYESGMRFVRRVKHDVPELDLLLCNGGVTFFQYQTSKSGHERIMQVLGLLSLLRATAATRGSPTRVTFVGSYSHHQHSLQGTPIATSESVLGHHDDPKACRGRRRYQNSKLVINAFVQRLATVLLPSEVIVNNVCPGLVATDILRNLPLWLKPGMYIFFKLKARTIQEGGRVIIRAAIVAGQESHGKFVQNGKMDRLMVSSGAPFLGEPAGKEYTEKLWAEIIADTIKVYPELEGFV
ncbi:hypothetical protein NUU61_002696 [Penicillium alfredii]|uniref:Uncharacterized protein n=1 Tax=Penicillium alfredii TaxID=1506179 RepID=A0A9W9FS85_9EURO|nr:uncharacterized protein NUU61_002696 [Penicillium alfredii]KAJ5105349.1 hypothetical protein NUU61_002696 [Penicillium alfredii]